MKQGQAVGGEAMRPVLRLGGEYAQVMTPFVASGEHMPPPHRICSDKLIRHGDVVFIDIGACWGGYFGDMARTIICGKASGTDRNLLLSYELYALAARHHRDAVADSR